MSELSHWCRRGRGGFDIRHTAAPGAGSSVGVAEYRIWVQRHFTLRVWGTALGAGRGGDREEKELEIRAA
jgi:hypothetical protein